MSLPVAGQTVYIEKKNRADRGHARVLDLDETTLYLDEPVTLDGSFALDLPIGEGISISYRLADGSLCRFETSVLSRTLLDRLGSIRVVKPIAKDILRVQRREFARVSMSIDVSYLLRRGDRLIMGTGITRDMSGGGLSFWPKIDHGIRVTDPITVKFTLPGEASTLPPISAKAEVLRVENTNHASVLYSLHFHEISNACQQRIVRHVFKRQIELRAKGV